MKFLKISGIALLVIILLLAVIYLVLPKGPGELLEFDDPYRQERTLAESENFMAATGTPWATQAALDIMEQGGNAFDAGMASLLVLNVTFPAPASFAGVAPTLIYDSENDEIVSYSGLGTAPGAATIDLFKEKGHDTVPEMDIIAQLLPASPDTIIAVLDRYGTMSFTEISAAAIELAEEGYPVHKQMLDDLDFSIIERIGFTILIPYNAQVYLEGKWWKPLHHREKFTQPDLASSFRGMAEAEQQALENGASRSEALQAVRDYFYEGPIADAIIELHEDKGGLFTYEDLAEYRGHWEEPVYGTFDEYTIFANDTWNQGAAVPMALQILEPLDLKLMGHNSLEYVHTVLQAIELTMADREGYFGDPLFVDVPIEGLLSKEFASARRAAMTPGEAFGEMPVPGDAWAYQGGAGRVCNFALETDSLKPKELRDNIFAGGQDTSYLTVVDKQGNAISLTPSDFPLSPMVPGTGINLGNRMTQFRLDPEHPAALEPGKRPRLTPNPGMVLKDGEFFMSYGTPGADMQVQAMVQVFLNIVVFGMDPQEAISAPRFYTRNFPDSFSPHDYFPGLVNIEESLYQDIGRELEEMGYDVEPVEDWDNIMGSVCAIIVDPDTGKLYGGADPREVSIAEGR